MMTSWSVANLIVAPEQLFRKANFHQKIKKTFIIIFTRGHMKLQLVQAGHISQKVIKFDFQWYHWNFS
jgi:hypothetical protein